ncbi:MAG: sterol desaturase family protein [Bacteroidetes bacterium]|nr:sterol desaturase family protein [Bacteroidota bacterium]MCW5895750.1 sterol desaturase family protein [Bacteroidota bacterium]
MSKNYVSNKDESARLFKSNFLEFFSHVHPSIPLIVYIPVMAYFLYQASINPSMTNGGIVGLFFAGLFFWTLAEYLLHRFVFHYEPTSEWGKYLHFMMHGVHHDYPNDSLRLVMPPVVSIPLALLFYYLFVAVLGVAYTAPFFAGFILGYMIYDSWHYASHHFALKSSGWLWLKQYHMLHHYQDPQTRYGVSSPLWDYVFGTTAGKEKETTVEV